mgnify:CR=1 FL=1
MQQVGELILNDFLSNFESVVNRKDFIIKRLITELETKEQENKALKEVLKNLGLFLKDLGS